MTCKGSDLDAVIDTARRFSNASFPRASVVFLCGSWARGQAHADSDIDLVVVDTDGTDILFQGVVFEFWVIEVCAIPPVRIESFFNESKKWRSAPVVHQIVDAIVVTGDLDLARQIQEAAHRIVRDGPNALSEVEMLDVRWNLTVLLEDLKHADETEIPSLAAQCHTALARASLDGARSWRGDRKTLRRALAGILPDVARRLDQGLISACHGDRHSLLQIGHEILASIGGPARTYVERR